MQLSDVVVDPKHPWYKKRRYLHFDRPISAIQADNVVRNPKKVIKHSFYPFIHSILTSFKLSRNKTTGAVQHKKKERPISCAAHLDSHIYAYYAQQLSAKYEDVLTSLGLGECILAFRPLGKSNIEFAKAAFDEIANRGSCFVIAADIKSFFDNLDHALLKAQWCRVIGLPKLPEDHFNVYKSITKWCRVDRAKLYAALGISIHNPKKGDRKRLCTPSEFRLLVRDAGLLEVNSQPFGVPQGSPISAILSNIYMLSFDEEMSALAQALGGIYFRYCDDIMIIVPQERQEEIEKGLSVAIQGSKLEIQDEKTERRIFPHDEASNTKDAPLQYLGFTFDGRSIRIRESSIVRYFDRMRRGVRVAQKTLRKRNRVRKRLGRPAKALYLKQLYARYAYTGRRNFISYGHRAAGIMSSQAIKRQLKPLWGKLLREIRSEDSKQSGAMSEDP